MCAKPEPACSVIIPEGNGATHFKPVRPGTVSGDTIGASSLIALQARAALPAGRSTALRVQLPQSRARTR